MLKRLFIFISVFLCGSLVFGLVIIFLSEIRNRIIDKEYNQVTNAWVLLCQYEENVRYYVVEDSLMSEEKNDINSYILCLNDQVEKPDKICYNFTAEDDHEVLWLDENNNVISYTEVKKGSWEETIPEGANKAIFTVFDGDEKFEVIGKGDYEPVTTDLSGKYFSVLGDSVSAYEGYTYNRYPFYYDRDDFPVQSMWWSYVSRETGMIPCIINAGGGTGVTELFEEADYPTAGNSERCRELDRSGIFPDIIIILLGGNDCLQGVSEIEFEKSYIEMIEKIKSKYPQAEIYLSTYYIVPGQNNKAVSMTNDAIYRVAEEMKVNFINAEKCNLESTNPEEYFLDFDESSGTALHANKAGQELLGKYIAESILND